MPKEVVFNEHDGKTLVTVKQLPFNSMHEESKTFEQNHESVKMEQLGAYLVVAIAAV